MVKRFEMHHGAKLRQNQLNRGRDMAAAAILDLQNFKFLTIGTVKRFEMHHRAKLRQKRLNPGRDMAIFQFFKMAAAAMLDFRNF